MTLIVSARYSAASICNSEFLKRRTVRSDGTILNDELLPRLKVENADCAIRRVGSQVTQKIFLLEPCCRDQLWRCRAEIDYCITARGSTIEPHGNLDARGFAISFESVGEIVGHTVLFV
jgi:hypothetical protein